MKKIAYQKARFKILILFIIYNFIFSACATRLATPQGVPEISISDYENLIENKTKKIEIYKENYIRIKYYYNKFII